MEFSNFRHFVFKPPVNGVKLEWTTHVRALGLQLLGDHTHPAVRRGDRAAGLNYDTFPKNMGMARRRRAVSPLRSFPWRSGTSPRMPPAGSKAAFGGPPRGLGLRAPAVEPSKHCGEVDSGRAALRCRAGNVMFAPLAPPFKPRRRLGE